MITQSLSPGYVATEIGVAGGYVNPDDDHSALGDMPSLKSEDIAHSIMFLLSTPYNVNISEITIKPVGEKN